MSRPKIEHLSNCLQIVSRGAGPCICWLLRAERKDTLDSLSNCACICHEQTSVINAHNDKCVCNGGTGMETL